MWTSKRVELLTKRWAEGHSASEIARELGGVTRNAVIGKVHRLGLAPRATRHRSGPSRRVLPRGGSRWSRPVVADGQKSPMVAPARRPHIVQPEADRLAAYVDLLELRTGMCRWPIGDPKNGNIRFCGCQAARLSPYCAVHSRMAFRSANGRTA
jgi:GcrA cell cycle regulator